MIKIIVLCDFWNPQAAAEVMEDVFQKGPDNYKEHIQFVGDSSYTHAIILNTYMPKNLHIPKENIIGLAWEPLEFLYITPQWLEYVKQNIGTYFIGRLREDFPDNMKLGYPFMCHERRRDLYFENVTPQKNNKCCIIFSKKFMLPGHKYRAKIVEHILNSNLPIDIFGRGCSLIKKKDSRIKGEFNSMEEACKNYKYLIAVENTQSSDYISEKFMDCIYQNIIPIYWGGTNVEKYFGPNCCFKLSGNIASDIPMITQIIKEEIPLDLSEARKHLFTGEAYLMKFLFSYFKLK